MNFCRNPLCPNFGVVAELEDRRGRPRKGTNDGSTYTVTGTINDSSIRCSRCGTNTVVKSNRAVWEEFDRHLLTLERPPGHCCPDENCDNSHRQVEAHPEAYYRHGTSQTGFPRYRCKACGKTFSDRSRRSRHRKSHENKSVFQLFVSKVAITKIAQITDLSPPAVYDKIDFLYRQCLRFVAERERLLAGMSLGDMRICTDMQDYMVNWPEKGVRRTIQFRSIASSCLKTGYVLACHPQIDTRISTDELQEAVEACGDLGKRAAFREYARLWTHSDYARALSLQEGTFAPIREDQEFSEHATADRQLPQQAAMVHLDYLAFGHFMFLRHLVGGAEHVHFSLDADAGLPIAVLSAWNDRVLARKVDVAVTTFEKAATVDRRKALAAATNSLKARAMQTYPDLSQFSAMLAYFVDNSPLRRLYGANRGLTLRGLDVEYPFSTMSEPGKCVRLLTDDGTRSAEDIARLFHYTSLHQVDRFFMQVRRGIAGLERAPTSARRVMRKWYLYAYYSPEMVEKALVIYRTYFNFIAKGRDGKSPAMRLGLAKGAIRFEDVIYFS